MPLGLENGPGPEVSLQDHVAALGPQRHAHTRCELVHPDRGPGAVARGSGPENLKREKKQKTNKHQRVRQNNIETKRYWGMSHGIKTASGDTRNNDHIILNIYETKFFSLAISFASKKHVWLIYFVLQYMFVCVGVYSYRRMKLFIVRCVGLFCL